MKKENKEFFSLAQAAHYTHVERQAIYVALRRGQLKGNKVNGRWHITQVQLDEYRANKYNADKKTFDGELVFSPERGHYSIIHVSKVISHHLGKHYPIQHIYYLIRQGKIKAFRKGKSWVIGKEQAEELLIKEIERKKEMYG